ncbi:multicopper oxidase family [Rhizoctonia solani]|uniref:Multicopper oxidase family n=1 Tax=Rhizoctonia solani TaxID=456999 RepID=A0A8H7IK52_9AGAM|nr:multicopper oxidase family [Rhizoctonia solani]
MQMDDGLKGTIFIRPRPTRANPFKQISTNPDTIKRLEKAANNALMFNTYDYKHYMSDWWMSEWKRTGIEQLCVDNILINGRGQVACPNKAIVEPLVLDVQKPLTPKGCMSRTTQLCILSQTRSSSTTNRGKFIDFRRSSKVFYECTNTTTNLQHWVVNKNDKWVAFNLLVRNKMTMRWRTADGNYVRIKKANSITIPVGPADRTIRLNVERPEEMEWTLNAFRTWIIGPISPTLTELWSMSLWSSMRVIPLHPPHPMHKHSNKAWFLGSGTGDFPYETIYDAIQANYTNINIVNPPYRDDFVTPVDLTGKAWAAFRYRAEDVGPVILHCHIDPHLATGMAVVFMEALND